MIYLLYLAMINIESQNGKVSMAIIAGVIYRNKIFYIYPFAY